MVEGTKAVMAALLLMACALVGMNQMGSTRSSINSGSGPAGSISVVRPATPASSRVREGALDTSSAQLRRGVQPPASTPATVPGGIQKIVHQTWKTRELYPNQAKWRDNCMRINPDWEFKIYTDADNRALIADHYPWFLKTYDGYPKTINRIDAIRIFYLAHFGGIYMDLDYTCLRPFEGILSGARVVVAEDELAHRQSLKNIINKKEGLLGVGNSFIAAAQGSAVFERATHRLEEVRKKVRDEAGNLAGVWFIRELIEEYRPKQFETEKIRVLPMAAVSPMHWIKGSAHNLAARICTEYVDLDKCRSRFPNSTTVSFWTGTWMLTGPHGNPSTKLSVDRSKQVLLGLRREGDRSTKTLRELEAAANYTGPSGEIRVF